MELENFSVSLAVKRHPGVEAVLREAGFYSFRRRSIAELADYEEWRPQCWSISGHVR
jgi:hypothetical protein